MWLLIQHQPSAESKYARELCRPREPGNQRHLTTTVSRGPSSRPLAIGRPRGKKHPRARLVWSSSSGKRREEKREASAPALCGARSATRRKGKNSRYYRTTGRPAVRAANPPSRLPTAHLTPRSLWAARPRKRTPTRGSSPPSPPSGAFRAFRYYSARPS